MPEAIAQRKRKITVVDPTQSQGSRLGRLFAAAGAAVATVATTPVVEAKKTWDEITGGWDKYGAMPAYGGERETARRRVTGLRYRWREYAVSGALRAARARNAATAHAAAMRLTPRPPIADAPRPVTPMRVDGDRA